MKEQKKEKEKVVEKMFGMELTIDESLNKYKAPQYQAPKLKEVEKRFSKGVITHR
jgi:hypothetical protein